jgi:hypothetical protein
MTPTPTPRASSTPKATLADQLEEDAYSLTILHSNDTWGYVLPCG